VAGCGSLFISWHYFMFSDYLNQHSKVMSLTWQHSQEVAICSPSGAVSVTLLEPATSVSLGEFMPFTEPVQSKEPAFSVFLVTSDCMLVMLYLLRRSFIYWLY
jgi:hypothetical protein